MKRFHTGTILVAAGVLACTGDPTGSLRGGPATISISPTVAFPFAGASPVRVEIVVRDAQLNSLATPVTVTSTNEATFTLTQDALPDPNGDRHVWFVTPLAPGQAFVRVEAGSVRDSAVINVLPPTFGGTPSATSLLVGDEYQLAATPVLTFGATTDIIFGVGTCGTADDPAPCPIRGMVTSRTANTISVIVPVVDGGDPGPLTVENVVVSYVPGLTASLPTVAAHTIQNRYSDSDAPAPADPDADFTITPGGAPIVFYDGYRSTVCVDGTLVAGASCDRFYKLTLPSGATFTVNLEWYTDADVDILFCNAACTAFVGNFGGATGANPEETTVTLVAGTYNLWFNLWLSHDANDDEVPPRLYKVTLTPQ